MTVQLTTPVESSETADEEGFDDFRIHDEVRVGTRLHGRSVTFRGTVIRVDDTELWIGLASVDERLIECERGQPLSVATPRGTKALVVDTTFTRHIGPRRGRLFATTRPGKVRKTQLRAYLRIETALPIEISASVRGKLYGETTKTVDISAGGVRVESKLPLVVDDPLTVVLRAGLLKASANGVVVRVDPPDQGMGRPVRCLAIRFVSISPSDRDEITRYIHAELEWRLRHGETSV